ncbi:SGNH/GDSL hydrolase family protein [Mucilaginibacter hurinus]|uniref:SGNH/GDSL hydrolase family protein n=1 Tax=Mucilaginibacter hurinus TaxID=2201324 RepID=A0A367GJS2_9SPHI|nr:SGNH/GDSL hydrolase family protein [Mucilaginibacter hurinus]RCH53719.1 SGNH/GDSL hydrolase family protein [Mucilaginibacter hurinus]
MRVLNLLLTLFILSGCDKKPADAMRHPLQPDTPNVAASSYLALGDSYTIGQSVPASASFPNQLAMRLNQAGYGVALPEIIARTGWTTAQLIAAINGSGLTKKYNIVTLLIGVNNQYNGYDIKAYRKDFVKLLNTALSYADGKASQVFVVSIPDYSVTPFASGLDKKRIADEIDQYNAIARQESEKAGVSFTDITPISRKNDPALVADDGLHPSGKMYSEWVELLLPKVSAQLKK